MIGWGAGQWVRTDGTVLGFLCRAGVQRCCAAQDQKVDEALLVASECPA